MFKKLHIHMTIFCALVTGSILVILTIICLMFAQRNLEKNSYTSFLTELNTTITHLQEQDVISHQWLNMYQQNGHIRLFLYDGTSPIYYQQYHNSDEDMMLADKAIITAKNNYSLDIFADNKNTLTEHREFDLTVADNKQYYVSAGIIPKENGHLSFLILYSLSELQSQITRLRMFILIMDIIAFLLLVIFSWLFTKRMIIPLAESQKKQTLFIASASHELRAPLAVLNSGLEVIKKTSDPIQQEHFINLMSEESSRMKLLIDDMLLLANADSDTMPLHITPCQPDSLLLGIYEKFEPLAASKQISIAIDLPDEILPDCHCDSARLTQVFSILIDNAISYTPENGHIRLSLEFKNQIFTFRIADTGCGIPDKDKSLIFERFYRSEHSHTDKNHFGLGLCIAREIIRRHNGDILVEDNPGGGSCFLVKLDNRITPATSKTTPNTNKR